MSDTPAEQRSPVLVCGIAARSSMPRVVPIHAARGCCALSVDSANRLTNKKTSGLRAIENAKRLFSCFYMYLASDVFYLSLSSRRFRKVARERLSTNKHNCSLPITLIPVCVVSKHTRQYTVGTTPLTLYNTTVYPARGNLRSGSTVSSENKKKKTSSTEEYYCTFLLLSALQMECGHHLRNSIYCPRLEAYYYLVHKHHLSAGYLLHRV